MSFLKNIFGKKGEPIKTNSDFWAWFQINQQGFFNTIKNGNNIEKDFFTKLSPKLVVLKEGYYFLSGMYDDNTAELIITPDGTIENIVFVEELIKAAPSIANWKFTALKQELDIKNASIEMSGYSFNSENLSFYSIEHKNYPDEVDIMIVHNDFKEEDKSTLINGTYIFLDNYLGELNSVTTLDNLKVISKEQAEKELIPIDKLKSYLIWREKEFIEKYTGIRYNTKNDSYSSLEAELENGRPLIAIVNATLLEWDRKASHPWILKAEVKYADNANNGMPDSETYELLNKMEDDIMLELRDADGYLNIGRQTADNSREIYFACRDFRKPSLVLHDHLKKYSGKLDMTYEIYKDKYWRSFERFNPH
ncbi:MAG: DUF695 domain-containing protein [Bacteroidetes bacterium]|nr:DUF695 domain-containing protein [Bacteroidota bacterium]